MFHGKTVVLTGAGSGVGRGLAVGFARDGADVFGIARTREDLLQTAAQCEGQLTCVVGDVTIAEDVDRLFAEAISRTGKVDVLVNNAAVYPKVDFLESTHEEWIRAFEINVFGMALCCRKALPDMLEHGYGRILNIGSFAWKGAIPKSSAYAASKGAVSALTRSIAAEIDRQRYPDVLVNELLPGVFRTRMSDEGLDPAEAYPHARFVASLPAGGPHGQTFVRSELYVEYPPGLRTRARRLLSRLSGGLLPA
jgi:NAD(P)-dependent dehydrogenase (short-subunit alcohol dehydrogenase family)